MGLSVIVPYRVGGVHGLQRGLFAHLSWWVKPVPSLGTGWVGPPPLVSGRQNHRLIQVSTLAVPLRGHVSWPGWL